MKSDIGMGAGRYLEWLSQGVKEADILLGEIIHNIYVCICFPSISQ
jgi:hypothetical protein